jgi:tetratricopeptide (TPR) repeat protein
MKHVRLPQPAKGNRDVASLRNTAGSSDRGSTYLNFQGILAQPRLDLSRLQADGEALLSTLLDMEEQYGSAAAFAFGLLFEYGACSKNKLLSAAADLDGLFTALSAAEGFVCAGAVERIRIMEEARGALKPWSYTNRQRRLAEVASRYLSRETAEVCGDCADSALLNTYLFLRAGITAGVQFDFEHMVGLVATGDTLFSYVSPEIEDQPSFEERLVPNAGIPRVLERNFLGGVASVTLDRAGFFLEIGDYNRAEELCERAKVLDPVDPQIYAYLGRVSLLRGNHYRDQGRIEAAQEEYSKALIYLSTAIELGTDNPLVFAHRGELLRASDREKEGEADIAYARQLQALHPGISLDYLRDL